MKYSIGYISGEYDGLLLYNNLDIHLRSYHMIDSNSRYEIRSSIDHSTRVYVTNIDNTSNREAITSVLDLTIYDKQLKCSVFKYRDKIYQFYIFAASEKFISNKTALITLKNNNTEELVKKFVNTIMYENLECVFKEIKTRRVKS